MQIPADQFSVFRDKTWQGANDEDSQHDTITTTTKNNATNDDHKQCDKRTNERQLQPM